MVKFYRKDLTWADFWVSSNEKLSDFYAGAWQRGDSPLPLLLCRLALLAVALAIFIWSLVEAGPNPFYLIFLTNWGLILLTAMLINATYVSIMSMKNKLIDGDPLPLCMRSYWLLFNISINMAFMITALYWTLLYNSQMAKIGGRLFWLDVSTHGLNSIIASAELLLSRTPVRLLHFYQPLGAGLWYAAFSVIYYVAGGTDGLGNPFIYSVLDWRESKRSGVVVGLATVCLLLLYVLVFGIGFCRDKITNGLLRTTSLNLALAPPDQFGGPMNV